MKQGLLTKQLVFFIQTAQIMQRYDKLNYLSFIDDGISYVLFNLYERKKEEIKMQKSSICEWVIFIDLFELEWMSETIWMMARFMPLGKTSEREIYKVGR